MEVIQWNQWKISVLMKMFRNFKFTLEQLESFPFVYLLSRTKRVVIFNKGDDIRIPYSIYLFWCGKQNADIVHNALKRLFILWKQNQLKNAKIILRQYTIQSIVLCAVRHAIIIYRINNIYIRMRLSLPTISPSTQASSFDY